MRLHTGNTRFRRWRFPLILVHLELPQVREDVEVGDPVWAFLPLDSLILKHDDILVVEVGARCYFNIFGDPNMAFGPLHGALVLLPLPKLFAGAYNLERLSKLGLVEDLEGQHVPLLPLGIGRGTITFSVVAGGC